MDNEYHFAGRPFQGLKKLFVSRPGHAAGQSLEVEFTFSRYRTCHRVLYPLSASIHNRCISSWCPSLSGEYVQADATFVFEVNLGSNGICFLKYLWKFLFNPLLHLVVFFSKALTWGFWNENPNECNSVSTRVLLKESPVCSKSISRAMPTVQRSDSYPQFHGFLLIIS